MLHSTFELITLAASNSLVVFCFCNLIIAILLVGSSKPSSEVDDEEKRTADSLPRIAHRKENGNERVDNSLLFEKNAASKGRTEASLQANVAVSAEVIEASTINIAVAEDNHESQEEEDDELRRRVEEFIEKVNRGWKAENLRTYALRHSCRKNMLYNCICLG